MKLDFNLSVWQGKLRHRSHQADAGDAAEKGRKVLFLVHLGRVAKEEGENCSAKERDEDGNDEAIYARIVAPALSSVNRHTEQMAAEATEAFVSMIAKIPPSRREIAVAHEVVERANTLARWVSRRSGA